MAADNDVADDDVDDGWYHGMPKEEYEATKKCMRQMREEIANRYGRNPAVSVCDIACLN